MDAVQQSLKKGTAKIKSANELRQKISLESTQHQCSVPATHIRMKKKLPNQHSFIMVKKKKKDMYYMKIAFYCYYEQLFL